MSHTVFSGGAIALAERKAHFREAEQIARQGIIEGKKKIDSQRDFYETEGEYEQSFNWMMGLMYDALGWVYFNENRIEEAEKELLHSYNMNHKNLQNLYHIGQLYEAKNDFEKAEEFYIKGMAIQYSGENPNEKAIKNLYKKQNGTLEGFEDYISRIHDIDRKRRKKEIISTHIAESEIIKPFGLKTLSSEIFSSEHLKGKIAVINFWGMWCGWSVKEMPDFQKLLEKYSKDPEVIILTINKDNNPDEVRKWMLKHKYTFPVLLDDGYLNKVGIHSFPTTWFIDKEGNITFIKIGWSEKLIEEFGWRIEELRDLKEK